VTAPALWQFVAAFSLFALASGIALMQTAGRQKRIDARIRLVRGAAFRSDRDGADEDAWLRPLRALGELVLRSKLLSRATIEDLEQTLSTSGHRTSTALPLFLGAKLASFGLAPLLVFAAMHALELHRPPPLLAAVAGAVLGLLLPDLIVKRIRRRWLAAVERGLPDALDLLIICAEAGLPLETGLERVAAEFREANRPVASEMQTTASEMTILSDRRQALINLGARTRLEPLIRLGGVLAQTLQYGTPLTQALRSLAAEMRQNLLTRFEERASRLPTLLTLPMIIFILPCVILVVGGPAIVQVMQSFAKH
jgi:tight adherence protein C